ncbi:hypothetical protein SH601_05230 [Gracilibacillus sp. S3-1-1]|uniref:Uncharacterized protein n=1 Tax=Gracilibacillus pellucidus TaxID=3095368 RepID=A0ACC6M3S5_9BACI|nr:hypothetical protein [Gracilibacillus sp. S3-1-1]MDX8045387.1 hypothetical protein [Gracilibacillus sp. S3-1-1]
MKKIISLTFVFLPCSCLSLVAIRTKWLMSSSIIWVPINDMKEKEQRGLPFKMNRLAEENKNDEVIDLTKDEILPIFNEMLDRLQAVDSKNRKIKKLNDLQVEAEEYVVDRLWDIITYYEGGDVSEQDIEQYTEELNEKYQDVLDYRDKIMEQYHLEQIENEDEDSEFYKLKRAED